MMPFNLVEYDDYKHIFEVKIEEKYEPQKDTVPSTQPQPPSPYDYGLMQGYQISILSIFKGNLTLGKKVMGFENGSSCAWQPKIGSTYIFYSNSLDGIGMCNRKLDGTSRSKAYKAEKAVLRALKSKRKVFSYKYKNTVLIRGGHRQGKRAGAWQFYAVNQPKNWY